MGLSRDCAPGRFIFVCLVLIGLAAPAMAATVTRSPSVGPPNTPVTVGGTGFAPNAFVDIYWNNGWVAFALTDGAGAFSGVDFRVPASAAPGANSIVVRNEDAPGGGVATFTVRANWPLQKLQTTARGVNGTENQLTTSSTRRLEESDRFEVPGLSILERVVASPVVVNSILYFRTSSRFIAYNLSNKALRFNIGVTASTYTRNASPAVAGGLAFVSGDNFLRAYNASTGALVWRATLGATRQSSSPVVAGTQVYVMAAGGTNGNGVYVFSTTCGTGGATCLPLWRGTTSVADAMGEELPPPVLGGGRIYVRHLGTLYCFRNECATATCANQFVLGAEGDGVPTYANNSLYIPTDATGVIVVKANLVYQLTEAGAAARSVAVLGDELYVARAGFGLSRYSASCSTAPCAAIETTPPPSFENTDEVMIAGGIVFVRATYQLVAYQLSCLGCGRLWSGAGGGTTLRNVPVVVDGVLYTATNEPWVLAFEVTTLTATNADGTRYTEGSWTNQPVTVSMPTGTQTIDEVPQAAGATLAAPRGTRFNVKVDRTPPTIEATVTSADGRAYQSGTWDNRPVTIRYTCSDSLSGIASCPSDVVVDAARAARPVRAVAVDQAGNHASFTVRVGMDARR
jgi:hypothetical protein